MARRAEGQISIFDVPAEVETAEGFKARHRAKWRAWLEDTWHVGADGMALYDRMVSRFGQDEADRRSKAISAICGYRKADGWGIGDAAILGFEDENVPCEVLWDRAFAARLGMPREMVAKLRKYAHSYRRDGKPIPWRDGLHEFEE